MSRRGFIEGVGWSVRQEGVWSMEKGTLGVGFGLIASMDVIKVCGVGKGYHWVCGACSVDVRRGCGVGKGEA